MARNPLIPLRNLVCALCLMVALVAGTDWYGAVHALPSERFTVGVHPASIPADGVSKARIVVRMTQGGQPRAHDYLEAVSLDSGYLVPSLALTNKQGEAEFTYTSLAASPYDTLSNARILFTDISLGRIVEVDKSVTVSVHLRQPGAH